MHKSTITTDIQKADEQKRKLANKHAEHDPNQKHDNIIYFDDTSLNTRVKLLDRMDVLHEHYDNMIDARNTRLSKQLDAGKISTQQFLDRTTDFKSFIKGKPCYTTGVLTIGSVDTMFDMLDDLGFKYEREACYNKDGEYTHDRPKLQSSDRARWAKLWGEAFVGYAKSVNDKDNAGLKVTNVSVHLDEAGAPHAHFEMVNVGHTPAGKPSHTIDNAVRDYLKSAGSKVVKNNKSNLGMFRELWDTELNDYVNKTLEKQGYSTRIDMIRINSANNNRSMTDYKNDKATQGAVKAVQSVYKDLTGIDAPNDPQKLSEGIREVLTEVKNKHSALEQDIVKMDVAKSQHINDLQELQKEQKAIAKLNDTVLLKTFIKVMQTLLNDRDKSMQLDGMLTDFQTDPDLNTPNRVRAYKRYWKKFNTFMVNEIKQRTLKQTTRTQQKSNDHDLYR